MKNKPMIIAQIMGKWVGGGVESVIMNYYENIDHNLIQFDFICDSDSTNIPYKHIEELGGRVIIIPPYQKIFSYQRELIKLFKKNKYQIVHSNINTLSVFPLRAAKKAGIPIRIAHSHSTSNKREWKKNLIKNILKHFSKLYATGYFACSELAGRYQFGDKAFNEGKVTIINNAIDVEKFKYNLDVRKEVREELKINKSTFVVGHIGRFVPVKNHAFLIKIFNEIHKKNNDSVLLLVGQGPLLGDVKQQVHNLNLDGCVKFLGQRNDTNRLYQAFDVFLLPSLYEGLPVVGIEAQASGLLCVLSNKMTKETMVLDSTIFMPITISPSVWANKILDLIENYNRVDTTDEISYNGFNIKNETIKLIGEYQKLLNMYYMRR